MPKTGLLKNIGYSFVGRFWNASLSLMITPFIIAKIGLKEFGVYVLMESIISYFSFLDMGFSTSFDKYIAEYNARRETENILNVITVGLLFYLIIGFIIILLALILRRWICSNFNFGSVSSEDLFFIYVSLIVMLVIRLNSEIFGSVLKGFLRYDVLSKIRILTTTFYFGGIFFF